MHFKSLQEGFDTGTSGGKLIFYIFGSLSEFEREIIRERTNAGLKAARARGRKGGRPTKLTPELIAKAKAVIMYNILENSLIMLSGEKNKRRPSFKKLINIGIDFLDKESMGSLLDNSHLLKHGIIPLMRQFSITKPGYADLGYTQLTQYIKFIKEILNDHIIKRIFEDNREEKKEKFLEIYSNYCELIKDENNLWVIGELLRNYSQVEQSLFFNYSISTGRNDIIINPDTPYVCFSILQNKKEQKEHILNDKFSFSIFVELKHLIERAEYNKKDNEKRNLLLSKLNKAEERFKHWKGIRNDLFHNNFLARVEEIFTCSEKYKNPKCTSDRYCCYCLSQEMLRLCFVRLKQL